MVKNPQTKKQEEKKPEETTAIQTGTFSQRFTAMVIKEFGNYQGGNIALTPHQQRLAQHMFIGIDKALATQEAKRLSNEKDKRAPIVWSNINMTKLAIDAVHRVELGLDALIPNHIHPTPYFNKKTKKYDLDLAIGYVGKDYYKREMALEKPQDIIYQLVHETDEFEPLFKDATREVESYKFKIKNAFKRGKVIGGFGYISFEDPKKNRLILVSWDQMEKSRKAAKTDTFWKAHPDNMQLVVVVRRTTDAIKIDPKKVNPAYAAVELDDNEADINDNANQVPLDIDDDDKNKAVDGEYTEVDETDRMEEIQPDEVILICPEEFNAEQPELNMVNCESCPHVDECPSYIEAMMDDGTKTAEAAGEKGQANGKKGPGF